MDTFSSELENRIAKLAIKRDTLAPRVKALREVLTAADEAHTKARTEWCGLYRELDNIDNAIRALEGMRDDAEDQL